MPLEVKQITGPLVLGEGPHWDDRVQALYFVSIHEKTIHKYNPASGEHTKTTLDGRPGFIVPVESALDQFVVGLEREFVVLQWDGAEGSGAKVVRKIGEVDQGATGNRINDGKADPRGRIFGGTMGYEKSPGDFVQEQGSLYRVDGNITRVADKIGISNGLAWDLSAKAMYYIDSLEQNVRRYDYDVDTGNISNMRHIFDLPKNGLDGFPDGGTIDTDGNLWIAVFNNGVVIQVSPEGKLLRQVPIPAKQVTSCTFGGPDLDILFVTTSRYMNKPGEGDPQDGCTFMVTGLGVKGHPNVNYKF
ncbi:regucalcin-like [Cydia fagiglandana]|uniref:regucalcin-like n=1 Tax=Cydia fagiglandana TaxID=1458189 RepID=UPI002FEE3317